jgi:hypothetical protein
MIVTFICPEWRDTAYASHSSEGSGSYRLPRTLELEVEDVDTLIEEEAFEWDNRRMLYFNVEDISLSECKVYNCIITFNSER